MIVVAEGPDGSGKTTLAQRLRADLGATVHHDAYAPDQWAFTTARLLEALEVHRRGGLAVLDRCWIGETIYGPVFRAGDPLWGRAHDRVLLRHGALYVFCLPLDRERYLAEFAELARQRPERYTQMERVYDGYRQLIFGDGTAEAASRFHLGLPVGYADLHALAGGWLSCRHDGVHYDRHGVGAFDEIQALIRREWDGAADVKPAIEGVVARASPWRTAYPALGAAAAGRFSCESALLVGEDNPRHPAWPFFRPDGSAAYLARALTRAGLLETDLAYVNAVDLAAGVVHGKHLRPAGLRRALALLDAADRCRRVVALGGVARATLESLGVLPDEVVRHPQLARRFDHHGDYHLELSQAVLE